MKHRCFTADYMTPFKSKRDIFSRLSCFQILDQALKTDAKWDEKIDSVANKFLQSRTVAEAYLRRELMSDSMEMTTEEDLWFDSISFQTERAEWKTEKKNLEMERERRKKERVNQFLVEDDLFNSRDATGATGAANATGAMTANGGDGAMSQATMASGGANSSGNNGASGGGVGDGVGGGGGAASTSSSIVDNNGSGGSNGLDDMGNVDLAMFDAIGDSASDGNLIAMTPTSAMRMNGAMPGISSDFPFGSPDNDATGDYFNF